MEITSIDEIACDIFGITLEELDARSQKKEVTDCKFAIYYFRKKELNLRLTTIGRMYGFSASGVNYGVKAFESMLLKHKSIRLRYNKFSKESHIIVKRNLKEKGYKFRGL